MLRGRPNYSQRRAAMGSTREARAAGYQPKKTPTAAEKATAADAVTCSKLDGSQGALLAGLFVQGAS
jgi:hypothetical protein